MVDRFQRIFDSLTEEVVVLDQDLRIAYANPAWLDRLDLTSSKVLGHTCYDVLLNAGTACAVEVCAAQQAFETGRPVQLTCQGVERQTSEQGPYLSVSPIRDSTGQVAEVALVSHFSDSHTAPAQPASFGTGQAVDPYDSNLEDIPGEGMQDVLLPILRELQQVAHYDTAFVSLNTEQGWRILCGYGISPESDISTPGELLAGALPARMQETRWPQIVADLHSQSQDPHPKGLEDARSWMGAPLLARDRVIGVLTLYKAEPDYYQPSDAQVVMAFAGQAAAAIVNAQLHQRTEQFAAELVQRAERLDVINRISLAVSSTLDLDQILQTAAREMAHIFDVKQTGIILFDPELSYGRVAAEFQETPDATGTDVRIPLADNPSLQRVMATKQPLAIADARRDPLTTTIRDVIEMRNIESILIVPLVVKGKVIGTIGLDAIDTPRVFTSDEIDLAQTIANQVVIAIENAQLFAAEAQRRREAETLQAATQAISTTLDLQTILELILSELQQVVPYDSATVQQLEGDSLRIIGGYGFSNLDEMVGLRFDLETTNNPNRDVVHSRAPLILRDAPSSYQQFQREPHAQARIRSWLGVPLLFGDRPIGMLALDKQEPEYYSERHARLALAFAAQAAIAIENSRLYAETRQRVRELASLMEVSQALNEATDLETILDIVLKEAFALNDSSEGSIILIDPPDGDQLRIVAEQGLGAEVVEAFNNRPVSRHEGTYRRTLSTGQIVEVADTSSDPDFLDDVGSRAQQVTNVPLIAERGPIGLIAVDGLPRDDTTRRLLMTLAGIAAVAIDKERLHQETVVRLAEVSTLYTLSTQITSSLSTTSVLQSIVSILRMTLDCRACSIFLIDRTGKYLQLEVASGPSAAWKGIARLKLGEGISGRVITEQRSIYIPDTRLEPDFVFFDPQIRSLLVVPLLVRGEVIGTLSIDGTDPNSFDQELRLLTIAAAQAAVAIENAQLYESLQSSYGELEHAFDELRHLDKTKSELIQNISHELRTPLTFIRGYVELLQEGELGALLDEQKKAVDIVASKSEVLSTLVDDIVSMLQAGREQIRHFAVQAARASVAEADLNLIEEIPEGLPPVQGDMRRLGQVFDNLLQNAIKFSKAGGTITVRLLEEETQIRAEVKDNGIGIHPDELDRIFDRFYQVDGTTRRHFGGTGLGLAIVKQIVEAHGGQVGVHSKVDQGSMFFFTIPKATSQR
jgi:GAF domain-containing protein